MLPLKATFAVFNFYYLASTSVLKESKPAPKVTISPLNPTSAVFNFAYSVSTLALKETSLDPTELAFPLTTEIFFSKLPISSGVATSLD